MSSPFGRDAGSWAFWLANCCEFLVDDASGTAVGIVEEIVSHPTAGPALAVAVTRRHHRWVVPQSDVVDINPDERRLTVAREFAMPTGGLQCAPEIW
jgi:hypothetical protein